MLSRARYVAHSRNGDAVQAVRVLEGRRRAALGMGAITLTLFVVIVTVGLSLEPGPRQWLLILGGVLVVVWIALCSSVATQRRAVNSGKFRRDIVLVDPASYQSYKALVLRTRTNWSNDDLFDRKVHADEANDTWDDLYAQRHGRSQKPSA